MPRGNAVPYVSYERSELLAETFLNEHHPSLSIPVPIEEIVELKLRLSVSAVDGMYSKYALYAVLENGLGAVWVDKRLWERASFKFRGTLAHEVGHLVLHRDFILAFSYDSPGEFAERLSGLSKEEIDRFEIQAWNFAGQILVPKRTLLELAAPHLESLRRSGIDIASNLEACRRFIPAMVERRSCLGCHEPRRTSPTNRQGILAQQRPPSTIQPGPDGTQPFSYPRLVQPVLNNHCVRCHDGKTGDLKSPLVLTDGPTEKFTQSYENLKKYVRWYEWGGNTIEAIVTRPGRSGADESPLLRVLADALHAEHVHLPDEDLQRLHIWLDSNVPFYGTYEQDQQLAQKNGQAIPPPLIQ